MNAKTPMLQQYFRIREENPGVLLAMRVGDFYEFYGPDAETAAAALELTLTGREDGGNGRVPMAGVPFHAIEKFLARLVAKGHKVALCDQLEDTKAAKGLVRRGVTRVLTPGTLMEDSMLTAGQNNFLAAICIQDGRIGLATLDPSTGEFAVTQLEGSDSQERLIQELARIHPSELLVAPEAEGYGEFASGSLGAAVTETTPIAPDRAQKKLLDQFKVANLQAFGCEDKPASMIAASMVLGYAEKNHLALGHVTSLTTYSVDGFMRLDLATRRSLELTSNMADGGRKFTLLSVLDQTVTAMGSRLIRRWIEQPLLDLPTIKRRQDGVERFFNHAIARGDLRDALKKLSDLERLVARTTANLAGPRDLGALRSSLLALPGAQLPLQILGQGHIQTLRQEIDNHSELAALLDKALVSELPHTVREGGVIRPGYDDELDKLRDLGKNGKSYIASLEQAERAKTGINTLKVGFNSVFGYYLEVSKRDIEKVPQEYIRKQTTANAERYITAELKEHESLVLGAEEKANVLEADLFTRLRTAVAQHARELLQTARALAELDVLASLAEVAAIRGYIKPDLIDEDLLEIVHGRHPVVEAAQVQFVPNDTHCSTGGSEPQVMIITGPNMSGKSTYLRQNALIVLMSQIGSFVPAKSCRLSLTDRIFARIGAKDELALGQSTFMVEMVESANILNHATERSLVILDEVGRGTSTYDGLAIAWAMVEHLASLGAKTLFATHYHQLNALAEQIPCIANFRVSVEEIGDDIVWTHKVLPGGTDRSYGIHVARMAGVPSQVLKRAGAILAELEGANQSPTAVTTRQSVQLTLFEAEPSAVEQELQGLDVNGLTPLEALKLLDDWKRKLVGKN